MAPYKEKEVEKLFYSIGEVAKKYKVKPSMIRFWDKEFDILKPQKNKKGNRQFTPKDLENLSLIYKLLKEDGYTIDGAKKALKKRRTPNPPNTNTSIIKELKDIKQQLQKVYSELNPS